MYSTREFSKIIICAVLTSLIQLSQSAFLRCYNGTSLEDYVSTPVHRPLAISPCINNALPTIVYTFGYQGRSNGPATSAVLTAYLAKKKRNVLLVDWEKEAKSSLLGLALGYALYAVPNSATVGKELGEALVQLAGAGLDTSQIHLMGHSLGAHLMGYAGQYTRKKGHVISRITGLDPARALFEGTLTLHQGLDRTCAKFVDIVHTDPGGYGVNSSYGTVDIWPNYSPNGKQPGCPEGNFDTFSREDLCNHDRSWRYYLEAIANPTAFPAAKAKTYEDWLAGDGNAKENVYIGDLTNTRAKGNFYLRTNSISPFGMGIEGTESTRQTRKHRPGRSWFRLRA